MSTVPPDEAVRLLESAMGEYNSPLAQEIGTFIGAIAHAFHGIEQVAPEKRTTAYLLSVVHTIFEKTESAPESYPIRLESQLEKAIARLRLRKTHTSVTPPK